MVFTDLLKPVALLLALFFVSGCTRGGRQEKPREIGRLKVAATIFPAYELTRAIGGEHVSVTMILPPGFESHSFEPRPDDIARVSGAAFLVQVHRVMEPWAAKIAAGAGLDGARIVESAAAVTLEKTAGDHARDGHGHGEKDPHVWLDPSSYGVMAEAVAGAFTSADPANAGAYAASLRKLKESLASLDENYRTGLSSCRSRTVVHAGHSAFSYLARRYGLNYEPLMESSGDAEPSPSRMALMVRTVRSSGASAVFAEELVSARLAESLAAESGVKVLRLSGAHNMSKDDLFKGVTYIDLMEKNLENLAEGLGCRRK